MNPLKQIKRAIGMRISPWLPSCQEVSRLQSQAMDSSLPWLLRLRLKLHLCFCSWCSNYREHLHFLRHAMHRWQCDETDAHLTPEARDRIRKALRDPDQPAHKE
ncbi:MAG: hypothetical protein AB1705_04375 [Verrucomicrobiota bacterium]